MHFPHCFPFRYLLESDPAQWLDVHPETGIITAKAPLDRESPLVQNDTYVAIVLAADDGKPCRVDEGGGGPPCSWLGNQVLLC